MEKITYKQLLKSLEDEIITIETENKKYRTKFCAIYHVKQIAEMMDHSSLSGAANIKAYLHYLKESGGDVVSNLKFLVEEYNRQINSLHEKV